ncbi:MAG TPA: MarR family transcriptional regulator [Oscillatoriales cyanobacterium M59_W2019_021]|nr:MAG: MarR family transcriptional regulator [Cyanobacteria bacterium J055]HIK29897.1 MarR family transcriptional regulator [Oscillatoriales cyanobacterium M4454_W2019_049]HIK49413.1 MarR family transcriptional regulator [Oscillatoriales cyanobacterium M59_W2019_021]
MDFYQLRTEEWKRVWKELKPAEIRILYYLRTLKPFTLSVSAIAQELEINKSTVSRALRVLADGGWIDPSIYGLKMNNQDRIEFQVREHLKSQLGGLTEVKTPAGRIDLLTETEIIEVKRVDDWKSALGQILIYSGFYPEHQKRLHLFGSAKDEKQISTIANSCLAFDVLVSFGVVAEVKA